MSDTNNPVQLFSELLGGSLGDLISSVGHGVGEAQAALDQGALQQTLDIYDLSKDEERSSEELQLVNLIRAMGYQPTFYAIPETEVEAQISLSMNLNPQPVSAIGSVPISKYKVNATPMNAGNVNRFGLQANAMAKLKFKIVPVPPSQGTADLRIVPDFSDSVWDEDTKALIQNLGFTYELRTPEGDLITDEELIEGLFVYRQSLDAGTIANISNDVLVLNFYEIRVIPDLSDTNWGTTVRDLIENLQISYEIRTPDGTLMEEHDVVGEPITGQTPAAGTFVDTTSALLVVTVTI